MFLWCTVVKIGQKSFWKKIDHCVMKKIRQGLCGSNFSSLAWKMAKLAFFMLHSGQKSIWKKIDHYVLKKIRQGVCGENFSFLAWKMAKLAILMLHSGQKWSKVNLKKIWPFFYEKDQARALWWKFQLSSMKNGKVSNFDVAQWSIMVKSKFGKISQGVQPPLSSNSCISCITQF